MIKTFRSRPSGALLSAASILALSTGAALAGPASLPTGGAVTAGSATITSPNATTTVITQSGGKAILTWNDFSIAAGNTVQFNNGTGSTLNRVITGNASELDGALSATGSVYLINPNGIVIGKTGVINTGGTFVASTLDILNTAFLAGGSLTFSGSSTASVTNLGQIGSSGGDVVLIANTVENDGSITAAAGDAGLLAGSSITLLDTLSSGGKFQVTAGTGASATNTGSVAAAAAELRAYGGNVYALAGNGGGAVVATGVATNDGQVFLIAQAPSGATGVGDVTITGGVSFTGGANALTIDAFHNAHIDSVISTTGGRVTLTANDGGVGGDYDFGLGDAGFAGALNFLGGQNSGESLKIDGQTFTLLYSMTDLAAINGASANYALANSINASQTTYNTAIVGRFGGYLAGLGHTIGGLTINDYAGYDYAGLIGTLIKGTVRDVGLVGGAVTADDVVEIGALVGDSNGVIINVYTNVNVSGYESTNIGGLVGKNDGGTINNAHSVGAVSGYNTYIGGLTGYNSGNISNVYATGTVTGILGGAVGGLAGYNNGTVSNAYATGAVSVSTLNGYGLVGGLVGENDGAISDAYALGNVSQGFTVGGLVGENDSGGTIDKAYATGMVSGGAGNAFVGGLVGWNLGAMNNLFATGEVIGGGGDVVGGLVGQNSGKIAYAYATGVVSGGSGQIIGGLIGENLAGTVNNVYSTGAVTQEGGSDAYVGGLIGLNQVGGVVTNAYATGAVSEKADGDKPTVIIGGLIGENDAISNNIYSTGKVSADSLNSSIGGLVGINLTGFGTINNGYWNIETSGQINGVGWGDTSGVNSLHTAQMLYSANFKGFDFSPAGPWRIVEGSSFPYLGGQFSAPPEVISGMVYTGIGGATLGGATVSGYENGVTLGTTTSIGANGYYQFLVPQGTLQNADVVTYLTGTPQKATALATGVTGSVTGLNLYEGALFVKTDQTSLSGLSSHYLNALGGFSGVDLIWTPGFSVSAGLRPNSVIDIQASGGFTLDQTLPGTGSLSLTTLGGDISVTAAQTFTGSTGISLESYRSITISAPITIAGTGAVALTTNDGGAGGDYGFGLTGAGFAGSLSFTGTPNSGQSLMINGQAYTLLYSMADLAGIDGASDNYALANSINASGTKYTTAVVGNFGGVFTGLGHKISGFTIGDANLYDKAGLFGTLGLYNEWLGIYTGNAMVRDIGLVGGAVSGGGITGALVGGNYGTIRNAYASSSVSGSGDVGGLVGQNGGTIINAYATGAVSGSGVYSSVGGLVGSNSVVFEDIYSIGSMGSISNAYATGAVSGSGWVGGLVGYNDGATINNVYATGAVSGNGDIGGLVGINMVVPTHDDYAIASTASITNAYATGKVSGGAMSQVGGLVGDNQGAYIDGSPSLAYGSISNSYWNTQTSGQLTSDGGLGLTTAQMLHASNFAGFDFSSTGPWRIVEGQSFPYLAWQFASAPTVISGTVYSGIGGAAVGGATVAGYDNGTALATTSGANGYYQILAPSSANADVVTYLTGASQKATSLATGVTGSVANLNLYEGTFFVETGANSLSGISAQLATATGGASPSGLLMQPGWTYLAGLAPNTNVWIQASGAFSVDTRINTGTGSLEIDAGGAVTQTATALIQAGSLSGTSTGGASFIDTANQIAALSWSNTGVGGVVLDDASAAKVGTVSAGSGDLTLGGSQGWRLYLNGPISAGGNINLNAAAGIDIRNQITAGGAVSLISSQGGIAEYGAGAISAASLSGSGLGANLSGANQVATITGFSAPQGFVFNNTVALNVAGPINASGGYLYLTTTAGDLDVNGALSAGINASLRTAGNLALDSTVTAPGKVALNATGSISETGAITAGTLLGGSNGSAILTGANKIASLAYFTVWHGNATLSLTDVSHLTVTGPVQASSETFVDAAGLTVASGGSLLVPSWGTKTLNGAALH